MIQTRARLVALSPAATLRRGYAIVQHRGDGVVRSAAEVEAVAGDERTVTQAREQVRRA